MDKDPKRVPQRFSGEDLVSLGPASFGLVFHMAGGGHCVFTWPILYLIYRISIYRPINLSIQLSFYLYIGICIYVSACGCVFGCLYFHSRKRERERPDLQRSLIAVT